MKRFAYALAIALALVAEGRADEPRLFGLLDSFNPWNASAEEATLVDLSTYGREDADDAPTTAELATFSAYPDLAQALHSCALGRRGSARSGNWQVSLTQTAEYVTNLALPISLTPNNTLIDPNNILNLFPVAPIPISSLENDGQFQTSAGIQYTKPIGNSSLAAGYNYYQNLHPDVTELNLNSHGAFLRANLLLTERWTGVLDYNYIYYFLSDSSFVSQNRAGASLLFTPSTRWNFKFGYDFSRADFKKIQPQDSNNTGLRAEAIRYLDNRQGNYITAGYVFGLSNAAYNGFSYDLNSPFVGSRFYLGSARRWSVTNTVIYGRYDFNGFDSIQTTTIREDRILSMSTRLDRYVTDRISLFGTVGAYNSNSNVARQDYESYNMGGGVSILW